MNFETLYKKWKFLADAEKRLSGNTKKSDTNRRNTASQNAKTTAKSKGGEAEAEADDTKDKKNNTANSRANNRADSKKTRGFTKEVTLNDSTSTEVKHGQNSKRLIVRATTAEGKTYKLKYKKVDANTIKVKNHDSIPIKINIVAKRPLEDLSCTKPPKSLHEDS